MQGSESEVAHSCPTPSDPMDCSLSGSSVHGVFQARVLEWIAISFSISDKTVLKIKEGRTLHNDQGINPRGRHDNLDIYAANTGAPQYIRQTLTDIKGEIDSNTIIGGDFNTQLTPMDRS